MKSPFSPPLPEEKPRRRWALPVIILVVALLPVLVGVTWFISYRASGSSAVQQLEAKIKARGEPVTLADLAATYPPIPDQSNGAVLLLREWKKESPAYWQAFEDGAKSLPTRMERHEDEALPFLGSDLKRVSRSTVLQSSNLVAAEDFLKENKEHLDAIRTALRYPRFRFPLLITNGYAAELPHLSQVRREAQSFRVVALLATERGDVDGAIDALEDTARTGDVVATDPFLIGQLLHVGNYSMVIEDLERLMTRQSLSAARLEKVEDLLNRLQISGSLRKAFIGERTMGLAFFKLPAAELARINSTRDDGSDIPSTRTAQLGIDALKLTGLRDADERLLLETYEQAIALADRDEPDTMRQYEELFQTADVKARKFPPKVLCLMLLPPGNVTQRFAQFEARRRSAMTAIAVERYRLAHDGHLPAKLDELKPQLLKDIPKDPFDGQPLRFKPLSTGYMVYSVGANRVDDGGVDRAQRYPRKDYDETFTVER